MSLGASLSCTVLPGGGGGVAETVWKGNDMLLAGALIISVDVARVRTRMTWPDRETGCLLRRVNTGNNENSITHHSSLITAAVLIPARVTSQRSTFIFGYWSDERDPV